MHGLERMFKAPLAPAQAVLPGIVGAIGKPQAERVAASLAHDLAAIQHMRHRRLAHPGIRVAK